MTKEDYMKLSKERLAELLVERDNLQQRLLNVPMLQCYHPDGVCSNPFHDCINCPRIFNGSGLTTTNNQVNQVEEQECNQKEEKLKMENRLASSPKT